MKLFLAGGFLDKGADSYVWHLKRLYSYFYLLDRSLTMEEFGGVLKRRKKHNKLNPGEQIVDLFLDSGAYSAATQGVEINLEEYAEFVKKYQKYISVFANLDVIGDAEASYQNQLKLEALGLNPMPVFHHNEPWEYLDLYIEKYDYIGLGGTARAGAVIRDRFLDECWTRICDKKTGIPKVKVHGFGLTSIRHMIRYPWYSVDSTSWVLTGRFGFIFVPRRKNNKWVYDEASFKIGVSTRSPSMKEKGQHFTTMSPTYQKVILEYIEEKGFVIGSSEYKREGQDYVLAENESWHEKKPKDPNKTRMVEIVVEAGLSNTSIERDKLNIIYFQDLEKTRPEWPWPLKLVKKPATLF